MLLNKIFSTKYYFPATLSYGIIRKSYVLKDATIKHYDSRQNKYIRVPMLLMDKTVLTAFCAVTSVYGWPIYLFNDARKAETILRHLDPEHYDIELTRNKVSDYIFT